MKQPLELVGGAPDPAPLIEADRVSKRFDIYMSDRSRFLEFFGRRRHHQEHWALREVSFQIDRGESFGVIGNNGAGKSTLLKLIAGISEPTSGDLHIRSPVTTLLDLGLGFHDTFSGRENIYLNCSLLGMRRDEIDALIPTIVDFAELGEFIDYPVRTYSAGMSLRLGFSIAAHMNADIFLVDEVLTVGDQYFQRKCVHKIEQLVDSGRTILLVSHDLHAVRSLCSRVLWLEKGEVRMLGRSREVIERYLDNDRERRGDRIRQGRGWVPDVREAVQQARYRATADDPALRRAVSEACYLPDAEEVWGREEVAKPYEKYDGDNPVVIGSGEVRVLNVQILDGKGHPRSRFRSGEAMIVAVTFRTTEPVERPIMGVAIHRNDGVYVYGPNTRFDGVLDGTYHGIYTYFLHYPAMPLLAGRYRVSIAVFDQNHLKPHVWFNQMFDFEISQDVEDHGFVRIEHTWGLIAHVEGGEASVED